LEVWQWRKRGLILTTELNAGQTQWSEVRSPKCEVRCPGLRTSHFGLRTSDCAFIWNHAS